MLTSAGTKKVFWENKDKHLFYSDHNNAGSYIQRKGDIFQSLNQLLSILLPSSGFLATSGTAASISCLNPNHSERWVEMVILDHFAQDICSQTIRSCACKAVGATNFHSCQWNPGVNRYDMPNNRTPWFEFNTLGSRTANAPVAENQCPLCWSGPNWAVRGGLETSHMYTHTSCDFGHFNKKVTSVFAVFLAIKHVTLFYDQSALFSV